jgi:hypothetical protein
MIGAYPSIYNLGHSAVKDLLTGPVIVEEKVDGSQISFGVNAEGELQMRSKGAVINTVAPEGMFANAVKAVQAIAKDLPQGWVFRGEYLSKPKHNVLAYDRIPQQHIIIFDINTGQETYIDPDAKRCLAESLGFECVPVLYRGVVADLQHFRTLLETTSVLGGQKIEGVVIKPANYDLYGRDKKVLLGKFVSESFREVHAGTWTKEHKTPGQNGAIDVLANKYTTAARWQKALQHLREAGQIADAPEDIGRLMAEVPKDVLKECEAAIKDELFAWAWPQLRRRLTHGLPEWYKDQLLKKQFEPAQPEPVAV